MLVFIGRINSIDDSEFASLVNVVSEVFGRENLVGTLVWDRNRKNDAKILSIGHDYMLVVAKSAALLFEVQTVLREPIAGLEEAKLLFDELTKKHKKDWRSAEQEWRAFYRAIPPSDDRSRIGRFTRLGPRGPFRADGDISWPGGGGPRYEVLHPETKRPCRIPGRGWMYSNPDRLWQAVNEGRVVFGTDETSSPGVANYLFENRGQVMRSVHYSYAQTVAVEFRELMGESVFDHPKNWRDLYRLVRYFGGDDGIILDFFSGSATTAHAVMQLNAEDGGRRRHILVQLPEPCDEKSEAYKAGYATIAEIGKERIRRAGARLKDEIRRMKEEGKPASSFKIHPSYLENPEGLDTGFRVLKIDSSNLAEIHREPDQLDQGDLLLHVDNIKPDRTPEDLLFQVLLDWGVDLSLKITKEIFKLRKDEGGMMNYEVFWVDDNALAACFETRVSEDLVKEIAKRTPLRAVFRDAGYASDAVKINIEQIFKALSPHTELKTV